MKLNSILSAGLFAAIAALSMGAQAASDAEKATETKAPAAGVQADKKVKPHSHMEEKTGIAPQASAAATTGATADKAQASKPKIDKDKSKHLHPRDGK